MESDLNERIRHKVLFVDESRPATCVFHPRNETVFFENPNDRPVDEGALRRTIMEQALRGCVSSLRISWSSAMTSTWVAELLPGLTEAVLEGRRLRHFAELADVPGLESLYVQTHHASRSLEVLPNLHLKDLDLDVRKRADVDYLAQCSTLDELGLGGNWGMPDLTAISGLRLKFFATNSPALRCLDGLNCDVLRKAMVRGCWKLLSVAGLKAPFLIIEGCNQLDFDSIGETVGLRLLDIYSQRDVTSFEFVRRCPDLVHVLLGGVRKVSADLTPFIESESLRSVMLCRPGVKDAQIEAIASVNKRLMVTNGHVYYCYGRRIRQEEWYPEWKKLGNRHFPSWHHLG